MATTITIQEQSPPSWTEQIMDVLQPGFGMTPKVGNAHPKKILTYLE